MTGAPSDKPAKRPGRRHTKRQTAARLAAVQALYQIEQTEQAVSLVLKEFEAYRLDGVDTEVSGGAKASEELFAELVSGVSKSSTEIDLKIGEWLADGWSVERLEIILRSILRLGVYELMARWQVPAASVVSEYVSIADSFYENDEPRMVNAVLDRAARTLRRGELEARNESAKS